MRFRNQPVYTKCRLEVERLESQNSLSKKERMSKNKNFDFFMIIILGANFNQVGQFTISPAKCFLPRKDKVLPVLQSQET